MSLFRDMVKECVIGYLASCDRGQPRVRPMSFVVTEEGNLWSSTYDCSGKMKEFRENDRVEICFLDSQKRQLRVEGRISFAGGVEQKRTLLEMNPKVRNHFPTEGAEEFVHLEVVVTRARMKPTGFSEYQELTGTNT